MILQCWDDARGQGNCRPTLNKNLILVAPPCGTNGNRESHTPLFEIWQSNFLPPKIHIASASSNGTEISPIRSDGMIPPE